MSIRIYKQRNIFVTGGTFSATTLTLDRNDGNDVTITGFTSGGGSDVFITGGTFSASTLTLDKNDGNDVTITGFTKNKFVNNTLVNPTAGNYAPSGGYTSTNTLWGVVYHIDTKIVINGVTIEKGATGSGNLTTAIYKYDSLANNFVKVANTEVNTWNTGVSGFQTVTITETTLEQGIYLNALVADTASSGTHSAYQGHFPITPLGLDTTGAPWQGAVKYSYTYVSSLPATLGADATFWTFSNGYYSKFASFLLNQV